MRSTSLKIAILFSLTAFLSITLACDDFVRLRGKLVDQDGKPIAGAKIVITLNSGTKEDISGDDGRFAYFDSISPIGSSTINLTVTKDGFETFHADYN